MKPSKIIIATAILILLSSLLSGCSLVSTNQAVRPSAGEQKIEAIRQVKKSVTMKLLAEREGNQVRVRINLENPERKPVTSVQSWLSYDPRVLTGVKVDATESPFALTAPYDNTFDAVSGVVMVGRSNGIPITDPNITVATVVFTMAQKGVTMVDVYDYKADLSGHASVNIMEQGTPYNILVKPQSPALIIENVSKPKIAQ